MSSTTYRDIGPELRRSGWLPLPAQGKAVLLKNWSSLPISKEEVEHWAANGQGDHNTGIRCGKQADGTIVAVIDVDVLSKNVSKALVRSFRDTIGAGPVRIGRYPKAAIIVGLDKESSKLLSPTWQSSDGALHKIEILCVGQQFVAYGIHPDTGKPYQWEGSDPLTIEPWMLPCVTLAAVQEWLREVVPTLIPKDWKVVASGRKTAADADSEQTSKTPRKDINLEIAQEMLKALREEYCDDYDLWIRIGQALHHQFQGSEEALELWDEWSANSNKYVPGGCKGKWKSFSEHRQDGIVTIGTVIHYLGPSWPEIKAKYDLRFPVDLEAFCDPATAEEIIAELGTLSKESVLASWVERVLPLTPDKQAAVIAEVARLTGIGKRALQQTLKEARKKLVGVEREANTSKRLGRRQRILLLPEDLTAHAHEVEELILADLDPSKYFTFAGQLAEVVERELPYTYQLGDAKANAPKVPSIGLLDKTALRARVEAVAVFLQQAGEERILPIQVPETVLEILRCKREHKAPAIIGLVTHPIVLGDGTILATDGLHQDARLVVVGGELESCRPYSAEEAKQAILRIETTFLDGFEFATDLDLCAALALLFTAVERRVLDMAPGFAVLATAQATGKTTLCRRTHLVLSQRDMPVTVFSDRDEAETRKAILSMLLASPAMVCLDNLADGITMRSSVLAMALTSSVFKDRILGATRDVEVPTNVLFTVTGNNLRLGLDENSRWVTVRMDAKTATPEKRRFRNPDLVKHAKEIRSQVLRDVVGIVAGFLQSGERIPPASRFVAWDRMVRQPLLWAGKGDVADVFDQNSAESEELRAHSLLIEELHRTFGETEFKAGAVVKQATGRGVLKVGASFDDAGAPQEPAQDGILEDNPLEEALEALRVRNINSAKGVGWVLNRFDRRRCVIKGREMWLESSPGRAGSKSYRIRLGQ